ncbi:hypothetical protein ACWGK5_31595 [Rhodococcus qingshengii]
MAEVETNSVRIRQTARVPQLVGFRMRSDDTDATVPKLAVTAAISPFRYRAKTSTGAMSRSTNMGPSWKNIERRSPLHVTPTTVLAVVSIAEFRDEKYRAVGVP